jgi:hypothetical protein
MFIDLGSVSEDILKDGKKEFENGSIRPISRRRSIAAPFGEGYRPTPSR